MSQEQNGQPQVPLIMNITLSIEEAQLILNKLNTCNFLGFNEASQAMTIFTKIKSAPKVPAQPAPAPIDQVSAGTTASDFGPRTTIPKSPDSPVKKNATPTMTELNRFAKKETSEELPPNEDDDTRPGAPLMQVKTKPFKQPFTEDKNGDLEFSGEGEVTVGEEGFEEVSDKEEAPLAVHTSSEGTTIVEGASLTDNDDVAPIPPSDDEPAFSVVNNTSGGIIEHPNPEDLPPEEGTPDAEADDKKTAANEYI